MRRVLALLCLLALSLGGGIASSVPGPGVDLRIDGLAAGQEEAAGAVVAVDSDDDDLDGAPDRADETVPPGDPIPLVVTGRGPLTLRAASGGDRVRVLRAGRPVALPLRLTAAELPARLALQGVRASAGPRDVLLVAGRADDPTRTDSLVVTVVGMAFLDGMDLAIPPTTRALAVSHAVAVDGTLPLGSDYEAASANGDDVRLEVFDAGAAGTSGGATLEAVDPATGIVRDGIELSLARPDPARAFRSPFVRIVADEMDERALEERSGLALRVGLGDEVRATYGGVRQSIRVGRPGWEDGADAARTVQTRVVVVRESRGGPLSVGTDEADARRIAREQIAIANEIWAQCGIGFGDPDDVPVSIVDPPAGVDLSDGLLPFGDANASVGTAEEQALLGAVIDRDPTTIDVVIVNRFTGGGRQGESFIASDRSPLSNVVVLDDRGIENERTSWTQSHEIGHVLLDQGGHAQGDHLLMDSDAALASVYGPKRISRDECARARRVSDRTLLARAELPRGLVRVAAAWDTGYPRPAVPGVVRAPAWAPLAQIAIVPLGPPSGGTPSSPPMVLLPTIPLAPLPPTPLYPVVLVPIPPGV